MYCNIDLGKNIKGDSFFKLSSLLKSLKTLLGHRSSYCTKVRQDETLCIIFPEFY